MNSYEQLLLKVNISDAQVSVLFLLEHDVIHTVRKTSDVI